MSVVLPICSIGLLVGIKFAQSFIHISPVSWCKILASLLCYPSVRCHRLGLGGNWVMVAKKDSDLIANPSTTGRFSRAAPMRRSSIATGGFTCGATDMPQKSRHRNLWFEPSSRSRCLINHVTESGIRNEGSETSGWCWKE